MKLFLIITANNYPEGDAGSLRQHSFAKILKSIGYNPLVIGMGKETKFRCRRYDGIKYISLRYSSTSIILRGLGRLLYFLNLKRIISKINPKDIGGILVVSGGEKVFKYVENFAVNNNIPIYHDSVEWYSPCEFTKGDKNKSYISNNKLNTEIISRNYKVFAISKYMHSHFNSRGISSLRVPVILDVLNTPCLKNVNEKFVKIIYAGQAGKKDYLREIIEAIETMPLEYQNKLHFVVIGMSEEEYEKNVGHINKCLCSNVVEFLGRIPRNKVLEHLTTADYTIFLRPNKERYAKAGFPTKFVESMTSATPVITNLTSDLHMYLENGINGFIIDGESTEKVREALIKAISTTPEKRKDMQNAARFTAETNFDYRLYIDSFSKYIVN